jgi:bla regulator protein BlaR1
MGFPTAQELSVAFAWTLLHFFWQGLLIGALYAIGKRLSASVRWHHATALGGLGLLLASPIVTFCLLAMPTGDLAIATTAPAVADAVGSGAVAADLASSSDGWAYGLVGVWLLGALIVGSRLVRDWHEVRRAIRESADAPLELLAVMSEQIKRMRIMRTVRLRLTDRISTPAVYGFLRPIVLLPTALALRLPRDQLETLLIHELAHIRRADFLVNTLALVARTLLYFHPVVHWICRDLERTRETLCDDLVVELKCDRLKYARALSTVEHFRQNIPVPLLTAVGGELTSRVHRILELEQEKPRESSRAPLMLAIAAILTTITGLNVLTYEQVAAARPEFRAIYGALMGASAPELTPSDLAASLQPPTLPTIVFQPAGMDVPDNASAAVIEPVVPSVLSQTTDPAPIVDDASTLAVAADADASSPADIASPPAPGVASILPASNPAPIETATAADPVAESAAAHDGASDTAAAAAPNDELSAEPPRVVRHALPSYPASAMRYGTRGSVTLSYSLDQRGIPADVKIEAAEPPGVFEEAALDAFRRWRFDPDSSADGARHSQLFSFSLDGQPEFERCIRKTGSNICRGRPEIRQTQDEFADSSDRRPARFDEPANRLAERFKVTGSLDRGAF